MTIALIFIGQLLHALLRTAAVFAAVIGQAIGDWIAMRKRSNHDLND